MAEHRARSERPLVQCVVPVLYADMRAVERVVRVGDVAGGKDTCSAGLQVLVDEDPVVDGDTRPCGKFDARCRSDPHDDVAVEHPAIGRSHPLDGRRALECLNAGAHQHLDAVVGVDIAVDRADLGPPGPAPAGR